VWKNFILAVSFHYHHQSLQKVSQILNTIKTNSPPFTFCFQLLFSFSSFLIETLTVTRFLSILLLHSIITDSAMSVPVSSNDSVSHERRFLKHIRDNVHGNIFLEPVTVFSVSRFLCTSTFIPYMFIDYRLQCRVCIESTVANCCMNFLECCRL
jgi:hypothetical protein